MKKLRIAVIVGTFPSLSETFILNQITGLIDQGHEIRVFPLSPTRASKVQDDVVKYNLQAKTQYPQKLSKYKFIQRFRCLFKWLCFLCAHPNHAIPILKANLKCRDGFSHKRFLFSMQLFQTPFDLVHCHFGPNAQDIVELKKSGLSIPLITSFHGYDINSYPLTAGKDCYKDLFSVGECFTANTNYTKQRVIEHGCKSSNIFIVHESLHCNKFFVPIESRPPAGKTVKLLTVGRMVEKKGYPYSLKAVAKIISKGYAVEYWAVGDGPLMETMQKLSQVLNITSSVKFMGALTESEVLKLYRKADIFMLPSVTASDGDKEGQGLVLQEAQMSGLPVISTLHNGIPDGVLDKKSGFLVPEKDTKALSDKIIYLIQHPEIRKKFGQTGQAFVQIKFDVSSVIKSLLAAYSTIINKK